MQLTPRPTQLTGAEFLAGRKYAMLADEPRVGKTGAAIIASDYVVAQRVLVITTKSGQAVWRRGFPTWTVFPRPTIIAKPGRAHEIHEIAKGPCVVIVSWSSFAKPDILAALLSVKWDLILPDEEHRAKNFDSLRTQTLYGVLSDEGQTLIDYRAVATRGDRLWQLTGSPYPHDLSDGYTRLRACAPHMLRAQPERGWPDVTIREKFRDRYCYTRPKQISPIRWIDVVVGGRNEDEFRARFSPYLLRRTQKDVGILEPVYDFMPLIVSERALKEIEGQVDAEAVMRAISENNTKALEMHLGPLMRLTGELKARAVVEAVTEEIEDGLDRIVLAYWHRNVRDILEAGLKKFGVTYIDGSVTSDDERMRRTDDFAKPQGPKVFLAQIEAAGEAIDLSPSGLLWFVETVISPRGMSQMSKRITNFTQTRTPLVKVCTILGSIDEAIQASLMRLWVSINKGT